MYKTNCLCIILLSTLCFIFGALDNSNNEPTNDHTIIDPSEQLFIKLFMKRRREQLDAVKRILAMDNYEKQYKMVTVIAEKVFHVIQASRVQLESSGYIPGSSTFPKDENILDALANILENTALFGEILLRLPDITHKILASKHDWEILIQWSIGFANQTHLLDKQTLKLIYLVSQELNIQERDPDYINPYSNNYQEKQKVPEENVSTNTAKKKKKKEYKKGPRMSSGSFSGEL
ncbi:hypothetical protein C0J52_22624 [Blattella germanica]|nr:hypothetical protein C0J52_22624 [Blattella germanica]